MDDEIVISGTAGRYPGCNSFDEFKDALLNGIDLVTEDDKRFPPGIYGTPKRSGKINDVEYFDAGYFGVSPRQADLMDPRHRVLLETVFETIVDAGYNPTELRGTKTGVYVGISYGDSNESFRDIEHTNGYVVLGTSLGQAANRTSYCFDLKGPSFVMDTACSSGFYAFTNAFKAIENGDIDSAIVSAVHINFHPFETQSFNLLNMLAQDGKCKVFHTERDGYARSEGVVTMLLQKKSKCRRLYATVLGADFNCDGFKIEGITYPSSAMQMELMDLVFKKYKLNADDTSYVEVHGTGTPSGDIAECQSVVDFFCHNRKEPLLIGSVKSNMGHSEVSAGLCAFSKVLIAMETGIIPANLHCDSIDYSLPGLDNGRLKVITKNQPWNGGMVALNCFGFGGANSHVILNSNEKSKSKPLKRKHRLVNVSGRTTESVRYYLDNIEKCKEDEEFLALIDEIHKVNVDGHFYRGYVVLGENSISEIAKIEKKERPIWFIYSGMGSQWTQMGKDLMKIDIFRKTFKRCADALIPYRIDLENVVLSDDPAIFQDITNCFAAITAIQIGLTDVLKSLGIEPDRFAGHSLGEVGCAYCNGDLTPEQVVLIGFARGYATKMSKCAPGQMAAIGLGKEEIVKLLPEGVYVACVNSSNSVTITGPQNLVQLFVQDLTERGIFARLVSTAGYAFHSKYLVDVQPILLDFVNKIITNPKPRSSKWVSSSWKVEEWDNPRSKMNSSDYSCNNYANPVLFDQVIEHIPKDAIVIEIAPHGLLTPIIKKAMAGSNVSFLSLASRNSSDNLQFLCSNIGKLFINGGQPNLKRMYNDVKYPVGRGTCNIGSLIKWDHTVKWFTPFFEPNKSYGKKITVNTKMEEYAFLKGHNIDGRVLMAATGYLELLWKTVATVNSKIINTLPIIFESVKILRATVLPDGEDVVFLINIMKQSGYFEIFEGGSVCCSGTVKLPKNISQEFLNPNVRESNLKDHMPLKKHDVYKLFHLKRYLYWGLFQGIEQVDVSGSYGKIRWNGNFTTFLDSMLQVTLVPETSSDLFLPTRLQKLVIDPVKHLAEISDVHNDISVYYNKNLKIIKSGGIEIINLEVSMAPRKIVKADPVLESQVFVPYITDSEENEINLELSLKIAMQIIIENSESINTLQACEVVTNNVESLTEIIEEYAKREPVVNVEFLEGNPNKLDFILCSGGCLENSMLSKLNRDGFVLFYGDGRIARDLNIPIVYQNTYKQKGVFLLRNVSPMDPYEQLLINNSDFLWLEKAQEKMKTGKILYLVAQGDDVCGIVGLVKCIKLEPKESAPVKCIFIQERDAPIFNPELDCYKGQLSKKLTINILKSGMWGSYRHIPAKEVNHINVADACNYVQTIGDLSTFEWVERPSHYYKSSPNSELVFVHYAALNFRDVLIATGQVTTPNSNDPSGCDVFMGFEYSGISKSGGRVMGISMPAISLQVTSDPLFTWDVPTFWSLEDAATIPVVYATCYYALFERGHMKRNSSILIHAGAGGVGIAAISIALSMDCEVFTTCGSEEKREFLLKMFPTLNRDHIGQSRNTSFEQMIMENTNGRGVDIVLNSLAADLFQASIRCVAQRGQFLEIGKVDIFSGTPISSSLFAKNTSFHGVLLDDLFDDCGEVKHEIHRLVAQGIASGVVRPFPRTVFAENEVEDAVRFLSTGKHKGKVLIRIRDENTTQPLHRTIQAIPKIYFQPEKTFILIGGLGGFGLELTTFLIKRCARKIVLNSRRGVINGYQSLCLKKWSELTGVNVQINTDDTSSMGGAEALVKFAEEMGPIGGIFNMALILQDALFVNQTAEKFDTVFKCKIYSGENMDKLSRVRCPKLDHFVVFSSLAAGRGNPGQSNYGMANSALERLCETRRRDGLPGLAIQYGPVGDVGAVAEELKYDRTMDTLGLVPQSIISCINTLETFMLQPCTVASTFMVNEGNTSSSSTNKSPVETLSHILGIRDIALIDKNQQLVNLGLDSLMIAEIKQTLYRNFNIELDTEEIRNLTFNDIAKLTDTSDGKVESSSTSNSVNQHHNTKINAMLRSESLIQIINDKSYTAKVFFIHPIEGNVEIMLPLAQHVNANIYGLQSTKDFDSEDLKSLATHFIEKVKTVQNQGPFFLCGYSYGGSLAFEMGVQLEKQNEKVYLFLIDGSPSFTRSIFHHMYDQEGKSKEKSITEVLQGFLKTFEGINYKKANEVLDDTASWEEQLERLGDFVAQNTSYNSKDIAVSAEKFKQRITAAYFYEPSDIFNGQATLIRANDVYKELPADYNLQKICKQPIKLEKLNADHQQILQGSNLTRIAEHINSILK